MFDFNKRTRVKRQKAQSRLLKKMGWKRIYKDQSTRLINLDIPIFLGLLITCGIVSRVFIISSLNPVKAVSAPGQYPVYVEKEVEIVKEIEVDRIFTTTHQQVLAYLIEKFGDDADLAIIMIGTCENSTFDPSRKSPLNIQKSGRRSYDIGVMQINVDEHNIKEQIRLMDWKYNIDKGYEKYKAAGNKFTAWTCATKIGQKNYLGQ